jgi:hypothetical protein
VSNVRADRYSNSLFDFEGKIFFTEYIDGDKEEVACKLRSVNLSLSVRPSEPHTRLLRSEDMVGSERH